MKGTTSLFFSFSRRPSFFQSSYLPQFLPVNGIYVELWLRMASWTDIDEVSPWFWLASQEAIKNPQSSSEKWGLLRSGPYGLLRVEGQLRSKILNFRETYQTLRGMSRIKTNSSCPQCSSHVTLFKIHILADPRKEVDLSASSKEIPKRSIFKWVKLSSTASDVKHALSAL